MRPVAKLGRDRLYLVGVAVLVIALGVMAVGPYADYTAAQERVDALADRRQALDAAVEELEVEAERLQDPAALEEQARSQLGLVRPGEIPYIVVNPPSEAPVPVNAQPEVEPEDEGEPSAWDRISGWVRSLAVP